MSMASRAKAANMGVWRAARRRELDLLFRGLGDRLGPPPELGWIRMIREAIGMSGAELGVRLGVSRQRVAQLEGAEVARTMPMATLDRVAAALGCRVLYALVPDEPLELMVRRQAQRRAVAAIPRGESDEWTGTEMVAVRIGALAHDLVDRRGLWGAETPRPPTEPP
jgi:predicted DNA-binding mobile mystery protein A